MATRDIKRKRVIGKLPLLCQNIDFVNFRIRGLNEGKIALLNSLCNSRFGALNESSGGSGASSKRPTIDIIELSDSEFDIIDTEE